MKKRLGKTQKKFLGFVKRNKGWQSFKDDLLTKKTIESLRRKGLVCVSKRTKQFKLKEGKRCPKR